MITAFSTLQAALDEVEYSVNELGMNSFKLYRQDCLWYVVINS